MMDYTIGDTPTLSGNVGANITGADPITVNVERPDGTTVTATGTVVDGPTGGWSATFAGGELEQVGWHALEVRVTYSDNDVQTFAHDADGVPMGFMVRSAYGPAA